MVPWEKNITIPSLLKNDQRRSLACYHTVTSIHLHVKLLLECKCEEAFEVPFNPLILLTTMANHHIDVVTHTVCQVEAYMCKGNGARSGLASTGAGETRY